MIEYTEFVANAVANGRHFDRRQRIHVTRRKPPESAVAQTWLFLLRKDLVEIVAEPVQGLARRLGDAEIEQVVCEMRAGQILCGEISNATGVRAAIVFHALDSVLEKAVADGQGERDVEIVFRRGGLKPTNPATKVVAECPPISSVLRPVRIFSGEFIGSCVHDRVPRLQLGENRLSDLQSYSEHFALHKRC